MSLYALSMSMKRRDRNSRKKIMRIFPETQQVYGHCTELLRAGAKPLSTLIDSPSMSGI